MLNGVDVDVLTETMDKIRENPSLAKSKFRISNKWESAGQNKIKVKGFFAAGEEMNHQSPFGFTADEPPVLCGTDTGANPVEHLLAALSSCMTTAIVYCASLGGFTIESLESTFEGDIDIRGFLNLSKDVPIGYQKIKATFTVKTDASEKDLEEFYRFSPVYAMVSKAVPIEVKIVKKN